MPYPSIVQKYSLLVIVVGLLVACSGKTDHAAGTGSTAVAGCYAYINTGRDSVLLQLHVAGQTVTGDLAYKLYEKDANTGTIRGEMRGDTLFADYTFASEGSESVREVAFLKKGNRLAEGYGEVEERNGRMVFKNKEKLSFNGGIILESVPCTE